MKCERCYRSTLRLYDYVWIDEDGEEKKLKVCWDCDFELINNRGFPYQDAWEIWKDRKENGDLF